MKTIEKVHVIPLGFERSVAVNPIRVLGGIRAHIITVGGKYATKYELRERQRYFERVVVSDLEKMDVEVQVHHADLFDFKMAIGSISKVILQEEGSDIYVNISSHGRLVSVAAALASWYHGARPYYVFPDRYAKNESEELNYGRSICGKHPRIIEIQPVWIHRLSDEERHALGFIYKKKLDGETAVTLEELIKEMKKAFPDVYLDDGDDLNQRGKNQKDINRVNRRFLNKLESQGFVTRVRTGRRVRVRITDLGEFIAMLEIGDPRL